MIDFMYHTLESFGHTHPIHPVLTHIPMGMLIGGFIFAILALKLKELKKTAYYCFVLALITLPPTILFGITDWLYRFNGVWSGLIISKYVMGGILLVMLAVVAVLGRKEDIKYNNILVLYALCMLLAMGLGYVGGEIIYG